MSKDFEIWWHNEGSGMPPLPGEDAETHVKRISEIAWSNGAFKAQEDFDAGRKSEKTTGGPYGDWRDIYG